jgi:PAS domain S-box-containing protein
MVNSIAGRLFGYSEEELTGQPVEILVPEPLREQHAQHRARYAAAPHVRPMNADLDLTGRRKDGSLFAAEISLGPMTMDDRALILCTVRDITDRNRINRKMEVNQLIQTAVSSILQLSLEPISLHEVLERTLDTLLSIPWIALQSKGSIFLVDENDPESLVLAAERGFSDSLRAACGTVPFGRCLCGLAARTREIVFCDGSDDRHEITYPGMEPHGHYCVPVVTDDRVLGIINLYLNAGHKRKPEEDLFLGSVADVLAGVIKRKRVEENLRKSEERFELAVRGTNAGIWDWDLETNAVYFSPRWKSMLGFEESEIDNHYSQWESRLHPDDRERSLKTLRDYLDGRSAEYELEHRLRHKDGSFRWILARGASVHNAAGKAYRMVGSHIDITDHKQSELELRQKEAQLLAAQKIQARFLPEEPPAIPGFDIAGATYPSDFAAGDLFDYISMPDGHVGFVIGDVAGHGIGPALVMASTHAYMHSFAEVEIDAARILARTNSALIKETEAGLFVTAFFGRLEPETRTFVHASAGHPAAVILDSQGAVKTTLERTGMPLAVQDTFEVVSSESVVLETGDLVLLLTDGVLEARSPEGELFGIDRALDVVREIRDGPAGKIVDTLFEATRAFAGSAGQADDVTIVVIKVGE